MTFYAQSGGQVFVTSTPVANPGVLYSSPVPAYPPTYSVSQQQSPAPGKYGASFNRVTSIWLGAFLLCSGAVSLAGSGLAFRYYAYYSELGTGLWCGVMFISAGAVGIAAYHHRTDSLIKGTAATGILTLAFAITQVTMAGLGLSHDLDDYSCYDFGCTTYRCDCFWYGWKQYAIAANSLLIGASSCAIIFGFYMFAIGCNALCCSKAQAQVFSVNMQYLQQQQPQPLTAMNHPSPVIALGTAQQNVYQEAPKYEE